MGLLDLAVVEAEMKAEQAKSKAKEKARSTEKHRRKPSEEGHGVSREMFRGTSTPLGTREDCLRMMRGQELSKGAKKSVQKEFE